MEWMEVPDWHVAIFDIRLQRDSCGSTVPDMLKGPPTEVTAWEPENNAVQSVKQADWRAKKLARVTSFSEDAFSNIDELETIKYLRAERRGRQVHHRPPGGERRRTRGKKESPSQMAAWIPGKISNIDELETLPAGTKPRTPRHRPHGGGRRRKRQSTEKRTGQSDRNLRNISNSSCMHTMLSKTSEAGRLFIFN